MKKSISIFSLVLLLFSIFTPAFTYANTWENQEIKPDAENSDLPVSWSEDIQKDTTVGEDTNNDWQASTIATDDKWDSTEWVSWNETSADLEKNIEDVKLEAPILIWTSAEEDATPVQCFDFVIENWVLSQVNPTYAEWCSERVVTIPSNVTEIWDWAWFWALDEVWVEKIVVPDSVTKIWNWAFYHLSGSVNITLWTWVNWIWEQAFKWSDWVWKIFNWNINLSNFSFVWTGAFSWAIINDLNITFADNAEIHQQAFQNTTIKNVNFYNASLIGYLSFQNSKIWKLNIQWNDDWAVIDNLAFEWAEINEIELWNVSRVVRLAFHYVNWVNELVLTWKDEWVDFEEQAFRWVLFNDDANITLSNVRYVNKQAFDKEWSQNIRNINKLTIKWTWDDSLLGYLSFQGFSIKSIDIDWIKKVGELAFENLKNVESINITWVNNWTTIDKNAFQYFTTSGRADIKLYNIDNIYSWAFYNYQQPPQINTLDIKFVWEHWYIDQQAFWNASIRNISIDNIEKVWWLAFQYINGVNTLNITWTNNWFIIENNAFEWTKISNINLNNVSKIGSWSFLRMLGDIESLNIVWNENWVVIEESAFQQSWPYNKIKNINIDNVKRIWKTAFQMTNTEYLKINWYGDWLDIEESAFQESWPRNPINYIEINNVKSIWLFAFQWVQNVNQLIINWFWDWVVISRSSFEDSIINKIQIDNLKQMDEYAFIRVQNVDELKIVWNENWASITWQAFQNAWINWVVYLYDVKNVWKWAFLDSTLTGLNLYWSKNGCEIQTWAFQNAGRLKEVLLWTWVTNIWELAFFTDTWVNNDRVWTLETVIISWADAWTVIQSKAFSNNKIKNLILWPNLTIWDEVFVRNANSDNLEVYLWYDNITFWDFALTYELDRPITFVTDIETSRFDDRSTEFYKAWINLIQWRRINFVNEWTLEKSIVIKQNDKYVLPEGLLKLWYELLWWTEEWNDEVFDFDSNVVTENKIFNAKWRSLQDKSTETSNNVSYLKTTEVTIDGSEIKDANINDTSYIELVSSNNLPNEIFTDSSKTAVKETEIKASANSELEYQWWVEVYLELTVTNNKERLPWTAKFSVPIAVKVPVSADKDVVRIKVKHEWGQFGYDGLTLNPENSCIAWEPVNDKYAGEAVKVMINNWEKYATIYTCSASTFVAYTEKWIVYPSAWGWRSINTKSNTQDQEHNSADINEQKENKASTTTSGNTVTVEGNIKKYGNIKLTRWEVAVMTNILLNVFPQLVEWKQELDDVENACSNYADEQKFTKDEKKAIARLCKLSIMWIHADDNRPLEEFLVNNNTTNDEFSKVINRSISTYNEKDLSTVKDALKKLENNEDDVVFWTLYDMFMSIKNVLN